MRLGFVKKILGMIPGSAMSIPLVSAMIIHTFFPAVFTTGYATNVLLQYGPLTLLVFVFFLVGTQFQFYGIKKMWQSGMLLFVYKMAVGNLPAISFSYFFGIEGTLGVTPLVLMLTLSQPNLAMYVALTQKFGHSSQLSMIPLFVLEIPLTPMLVLGTSGMIQVSATDYLAMITPFLLGILTGYLLHNKRKLFSYLIPVTIPFFAFLAGSQFSFHAFIQSGVTGLILSMVVLLSGVFGFFLVRLVSSDHATAGMALGSTAGSSLVIPSLLATVDERYVSLVPAITAQLVTVTVLTCILCPLFAKYLRKYDRKHNKETQVGQLNI